MQHEAATMDSLVIARIRRELALSSNLNDCFNNLSNKQPPRMQRGCNENGPRMGVGKKWDQDETVALKGLIASPVVVLLLFVTAAHAACMQL